MTPPPGLPTHVAYSHELGKIVFLETGKPVSEYWTTKRKGSVYGKIRTVLNGQKYAYHRLVWALVHGAWPPGPLDHVDQDVRNNRIENLRLTTHQENIENRSRLGTVYFENQKLKWRAHMTHRGHRHQIGYFATEAEARAALQEKVALVFPSA